MTILPRVLHEGSHLAVRLHSAPLRRYNSYFTDGETETWRDDAIREAHAAKIEGAEPTFCLGLFDTRVLFSTGKLPGLLGKRKEQGVRNKAANVFQAPETSPAMAGSLSSSNEAKAGGNE